MIVCLLTVAAAAAAAIINLGQNDKRANITDATLNYR
jgi:hypothetical protein